MNFVVSRQRREERHQMVKRPGPAVQLVAHERRDWDEPCRVAVEPLPFLLGDVDRAGEEIGSLTNWFTGSIVFETEPKRVEQLQKA